MGDIKNYNEAGGFDEYLYYQDGDILTASNGIQGKVVNDFSEQFLKDEEKTFHESLPMFSNTSEVYFKRSDEAGHVIEQARIYINRRATLDLDWGHAHGEHELGFVHVHEWRLNKHGKWVRGGNPRKMTEKEIARYGELLLLAYPVKF